jgi:hypothetical protein
MKRDLKNNIAINTLLESQVMGLSPEDSQMIDSAKFSVVEICRAYKVPLNLVQDHERSTYSNVTEQNRGFENLTKVPGGDEYQAAQEQAPTRQMTRGQDSPQQRDKIINNFKPLIKDVAKAILKRECELLKQSVVKYSRGRRANDEFKEFLQDFYAKVLPEVLREKYGPVLRSFAMAIQDQAENEMVVTGTDLKEYIQEHIGYVVDGHSQNSLNQLLGILETDNLEAVETRVDDLAGS